MPHAYSETILTIENKNTLIVIVTSHYYDLPRFQIPRRSQLLSRLGISFDVIDANVDEQWGQLEPATDYVQRIALLKAKTATHMVN